jgi:hypothetical protein
VTGLGRRCRRFQRARTRRRGPPSSRA